jgi:hypothetical protein
VATRLAPAERDALELVDFRLRMLLPEDYQDSYEVMEPRPMRSAGLKFDADGRVAWDEIWGSFCDLAVAGGPPHKGTLLGPGDRASIGRDPDRYRDVVGEICRGIEMVTGIAALAASTPGWIQMSLPSETMAGWLLRAITVENVAVHGDGGTLFLPAAPAFQLEREIKNVVTVVAKTCHYWLGHMPGLQRSAIGRMFAELDAEAPLLGPPFPPLDSADRTTASLARLVGQRIWEATGLPTSGHGYSGWLGIECPSVRSAVWQMRALVAFNVLSRREGGALFLPLNPTTDARGDRVTEAFARAHRLALAKGVL